MSSIVLKNLNFEKIKTDAKGFSISGNNSYAITYPEFIKYFENIDKLEMHHLVVSSHFVYGWMPTIITLQTENIDSLLILLNNAKSGCSLGRKDLVTLQPCINNSMVGLSKLLHFINPAKYAIWDSRIYRYLTELKSSYGVSKPELYLAYLAGLREISATEGYAEIHQSIERHFDYEITPMRAIEVVMYEADKKHQLTNKKHNN